MQASWVLPLTLPPCVEQEGYLCLELCLFIISTRAVSSTHRHMHGQCHHWAWQSYSWLQGVALNCCGVALNCCGSCLAAAAPDCPCPQVGAERTFDAAVYSNSLTTNRQRQADSTQRNFVGGGDILAFHPSS